MAITTCDLYEGAFYLSSLGYKMLLVDSDPQGNLTKSLTEEGPTGLYETLTGFLQPSYNNQFKG